MTTTHTIGSTHGATAGLEGAELEAWAADRTAAWRFMREREAAGDAAGYPLQVGGAWTVKVAAGDDPQGAGAEAEGEDASPTCDEDPAICERCGARGELDAGDGGEVLAWNVAADRVECAKGCDR